MVSYVFKHSVFYNRDPIPGIEIHRKLRNFLQLFDYKWIGSWWDNQRTGWAWSNWSFLPSRVLVSECVPQTKRAIAKDVCVKEKSGLIGWALRLRSSCTWSSCAVSGIEEKYWQGRGKQSCLKMICHRNKICSDGWIWFSLFKLSYLFVGWAPILSA